MADESLKSKTVKGTVWSALDAFLGQGVTFIVGIVLARLLTPDEYGLIGICLIFNTVLNGIVDSGFSNALIRKKDCTNNDYNTMFLTNLLVSIVLYVLLFFCTPFFSIFFGREELTVLIRVTSIVLIFNALSITQVTILTKKLDFKTKTKASLFSALLSGFIGICMAYTGFGVWALVGQLVSRQMLYTLALWLLNKWWPHLSFCMDSFRYMWGFGWKLLASGLLNNVWNQLYQVVVGRYYSPVSLGHYTRANDFSRICSDNFTFIVQRVSYPVFSELQDSPLRLLESVRKITKLTMFITSICLLIMAGISSQLILCILGPQWVLASQYLPYICFSVLLYPIQSLNLNILQVKGRSDLFLKLEIVKKILAIVPVLFGIFMSIKAMLICSIAYSVLCFFINSYYTESLIGYGSRKQLYDILPSLLIGCILFVVLRFMDLSLTISWQSLFIEVIVACILTIILCKVFKLSEYTDIKNIVLSFFKQNGTISKL